MEFPEDKIKAIDGILEEALEKVRKWDLDGAEETINKIEEVSTCPLCAETQIFFLSLIYVAKFPIGDAQRRQKRLAFLVEELEYLIKALGEDNEQGVYRGPC